MDMDVPEAHDAVSSSRVVDVSGQGISKVGQVLAAGRSVAAVIADSNKLSTLRGIDKCPSLIQLSVRDNHLVRMEAVAPLLNLVTLNLQNNSITEIDGLEGLVNLQWLCLAGNSIKEMQGLSSNLQLNHLDLSDNCIGHLSDISMLTQLKTLLLHGNAVNTLQRVAQCLPPAISTLSLAENDVTDLNELSFLSALKTLTQLSVMNNPCVALTDSRMLFDYRPYVLYCCPVLTTLDGIPITGEERQRSAALFSSSQDYPFSIGQHDLLVQYLIAVNPLSAVQMNATGQVRVLVVGRDMVDDGSVQMFLTSSNGHENGENIAPNLPSLGSSSGQPSSQRQAELTQKLKALQAVQQMIAVQEQLLQQQQRRHGDGVSPPPNGLSLGHTNMYQPSLVSETIADSMEQDTSVSTTSPLRCDPRVGSLPPTVTSEPPTSGINTLAQVPLTSEDSRAPPLTSAGSSPSSSVLSLLPSNLNVQELPSTEMANGVCKHQQSDTTSERSSTLLSLRSMKDHQQGVKSHSEGDIVSVQALQAQKQNQLHLLNKKIAQRRLQQMQPSGTSHMDKKFKSAVSSAPPKSMAAVFHGVSRSEATSLTSNPSLPTMTTLTSTHSLHSNPSTDSTVVVRMHPQTQTPSDVSKHVRPTDYRLPGVPSYAATTQGSTMTGGSIFPTWNYPSDHQSLGQVRTGVVGSGAVHGGLSERYSTASVVYGSMGTPTGTLDNSSDLDILESTSSYIPIPHSEENSFEDSQFDFSTLATSLTQAYGISDPAETSQILSSLVGSDKVSFAQGRSSKTVGDRQTNKMEHPSACEMTGVSTTTDGVESSSLKAISQSQTEGSHHQHVRWISQPDATDPVPSTDSQPLAQDNSGDPADSLPPSVANLHTPVLSWDGAATRIQSALRGYFARKRLQPYVQQQRAATKIQAAWRGHFARKHVPEVVQARRELYRRKLEAYVTTLYLQLQGCRQELAHQAHMGQLQEETVGSLLLEVDSLLSWKTKMEAEGRNKAAVVIQKHWRGYRIRKSCSYSGAVLKSRSDALWALCTSLKEQVDQLQTTLSSVMENMYVFGATRQHFQKMGFIDLLSGDADQGFTNLPVPADLQMSHFSDSCVLLRWSSNPTTHSTAALQGYRVFVNGNAEGMVGAAKSKAYIEGLNPNTTYRITIRAVYDAGESRDSNPIVASLTSTSHASSQVAMDSDDKMNTDHLPTACNLGSILTNEIGTNVSERASLEESECKRGADTERQDTPEHTRTHLETWKHCETLISGQATGLQAGESREEVQEGGHRNSSPALAVPYLGRDSEKWTSVQAASAASSPELETGRQPATTDCHIPLPLKCVSTSPRDKSAEKDGLGSLPDLELNSSDKRASPLVDNTTAAQVGGIEIPTSNALRSESESTMNSEDATNGATTTATESTVNLIPPQSTHPASPTFDANTQHTQHTAKSISDKQGSIGAEDGEITVLNSQKCDWDEEGSKLPDTSTFAQTKHMATLPEPVSSDRKVVSDSLHMDTILLSGAEGRMQETGGVGTNQKLGCEEMVRFTVASLEGIIQGDYKKKVSLDQLPGGLEAIDTNQLPNPKLSSITPPDIKPTTESPKLTTTDVSLECETHTSVGSQQATEDSSSQGLASLLLTQLEMDLSGPTCSN